MSNHQFYSDLPIFKEVEGHTRSVPFFLCQEMFGGMPFELAGGDISQLVDVPVASSHCHEVDEIYFLISAKPADAIIDVTIDGEVKTYVSPSVIHVPAGKEHQFITKKASSGSFCFGILYGKEGSQ
ncbi:hypothetical protein [Pseudoalteromonas aliena]|uniref:hypothetical protein n=1 Tax=Pseudoalteromonas aliena TaxID=247523 RepID=UPI002494C520|nr:hypothetical protein [Pseudoalteromonas aliena]